MLNLAFTNKRNMQPSYITEDTNFPQAVKVLKRHGFLHIVRMPRLCLYDCEAEKDGHHVYIEIRSRSPDSAPYFAFNRNKLGRLKALKDSTGREVYILLIWGRKYNLCEISNFPPSNLKPFHIYGKYIPTFRFSTQTEMTPKEIEKAITLRKQGSTIQEIADELKRTDVTIRRNLPKTLRGSIQKREIKCPHCGYTTQKGKVIIRIWASTELEKEWKEFSKEFDTKGIAFSELLRKAKLYSKIEKPRIAVEPLNKP